MKNSQLAMVLSGKGTEMFEYDETPLISHGRQTFEVHEAPVEVKEKILGFINSSEARRKAYAEMAGQDTDAQISQCIKCMFAQLDGNPDIDVNGDILNTEYVQCPKRGACKHEGIACNKLTICNAKITKSQERVVNHCSLSYKEIAGKLFISVQTVKRHMQDVLKETGIPDKTNLALTANEIGILN
jgi:DNA-binding CsgD family transcriptional regulator